MKRPEVTDLPGRQDVDERHALDELLPLVYETLRRLARQRLRGAPSERSLNTTGLVHEAYLRFVESSSISLRGPEHFLALASRVMRSVLVDHARARGAAKRGGGIELADLEVAGAVASVDLDKVAELDEALTRLERLDERQARMIEQRYFGGLSLEEIAAAMHVSLATVKRDLRSARAWLAIELQEGDSR